MSHERLTAEEEATLARRWIDSGDLRARDRLIVTHMDLVFHEVRRFRHSGPARDDLIQEGSVGLLLAAQKFDPARGVRFITYASYWVKALMMEFVIRSHGPVRISTARWQRKIFFNLARTRRQLERSGVEPTNEAVARVLEVSTEQVERMTPYLSGPTRSLDEPRSESYTRTPTDTLQDHAEDAEQQLAQHEERAHQRETVKQAMAALNERERTVLRQRHLAATPKTFDTLGARFGVTRQRVQQIEEHALEKLQRAVDAAPARRIQLKPKQRRAHR